MQILFYAISILGLAYFLLAKRTFDWFAVAFFSACVYFLPGFFGASAYLSAAGWIESPINGEAYGVMILVMLLILSGAVVHDLLFRDAVAAPGAPGRTEVAGIVLFLAAAGLLLMLTTTGTALLLADKQLMLAEMNRSHILFYTAATIGAALSFALRKRALLAVFGVLILFDLFIGFRTSLAIAAISILTLHLSKQGPGRLLVRSWKEVAAGAALAGVLLVYPQVAWALKLGDLAALLSVLGEPGTYRAVVMNSEPFITQSILNEVTGREYTTGMGRLAGALYQLTLFAPEMGFEADSFNDRFQNELFPDVMYGMANNIWAEMWSAGGWPLLLLFAILFVLVLGLFNVLTGRLNCAQGSFVAVMASYWAFYIHRNDLSYTLALEKRVLLIMLLSFAIAFLIAELKRMRTHPERA